MTTKATRVPYVEIAADIREQIRTGQLEVGARLPALRSMASDYGVAPGTVGAALEVLRREGLIDTVQGKGSAVINVPGQSTPGPDPKAWAALRALEARLGAEIAALREDVDRLQAQMMAVYPAQGLSYPHEDTTRNRGVG